MLLQNAEQLFNRPYYAPPRQIMTGHAWGWAAFLIGACRLGALAINGAWSPTPTLRQIGCAFGLFPVICIEWFGLSKYFETFFDLRF